MKRPSARRLAEIVDGFSRARVAVVGDLVADVYLEAEPARLSREAPVLIASYRGESTIPGAAANAMNNLLALGAVVRPVGVVGDDRAGRILQAYFRDRGLDAEALLVQPGLGTVTKTRVMLGEEGRMRQQVLRIDREPGGAIESSVRARLTTRFVEALSSVDAVIFSDYGYGTVDGALIDAARAARPRVLVTADSRYGLRRFAGVDIVTPNVGEALAVVGGSLHGDDQVAAVAAELRRALELDQIVVTRGNLGMLLDQAEIGPVVIPATGSPDEVTDVSGAGDTVIALITLARVAGATWTEAAWIANVGAGVVVTKMGAATVSVGELMAAATRDASA